MLEQRPAPCHPSRATIPTLLSALLSVALALPVQAQNLCTSPSFELAPATNSVSGTATLATNDDPSFIVHEDFDDDGNADLAIAELPSNTVSIWLGDGDGTFTAAPGSPMSVTGAPVSLQPVHFNGDSDLDLVVLARNSDEIVVLLGDGNGGFSESARVDTGLTSPRRLALADFDGVNGVDVAVGGSFFDNSFTLLLSDASGGFSAAAGAPFAMPDGSDPWDLAVGSFTGSGEVDLVINGFGINGQDATFVFAGNGDGTFTLHDTVSHGAADSRRRELAVADMDGDGIEEILTTRYESRSNGGVPVNDQHRVVILQRDGSFDWSVASEVYMGGDPRDVEVADINVDGNPDLVVANGAFTFAGNVAFGDGTLSGFDSPTQYAAAGNPLTAAVADLNNDGKPDFTIANQPSDSVTTYLNDCQIDPFPPEFASTPANGDTIDVGDVLIGDTAAVDLAIENTAPTDLSEVLEVGPCSVANDAAGVFAIDPAQLAISAGASDTIEVSCLPDSTGMYSADLECGTSNDTDAGPLNWPLSCRGVAPAVSISPDPVDFGSVAVGDTASVPVSVGNSGTAPLEISGLTLFRAGSPFTIAADPDDCASATLQPGASCTFSIAFAPASAGGISATLRVTSDSLDSPDEVAISGSGIVGDLTATPSSLDFGDVPVGTDSMAGTVTLGNAGGATLELTSLPAPDAPFNRVGGSCSTGDSLAPGESCTLDYEYSPQQTGAAAKTLSPASQFNSVDIMLGGNGVAGLLEVSPASIDFGDVDVGDDSAAQAVTLSNAGDAALDLTSLPAPMAPFGRVGGDCSMGATLAPAASCTVQYQFSPQSTGAAGQALTFSSQFNTAALEVDGNGVMGVLEAAPASVDFGGVAVGDSSVTETVTLSNDGDGGLELTSVPAPGGPFARSGGDCSVGLAMGPGEMCSIDYVFEPQAIGAASASATIGSDTNSVDLTLTGLGEAADIGLNPDTLEFGPVALGNSGEATVMVANGGNVALEVSSLSDPQAPFARVSGDGPGCGTVPFSVAAGSQCGLTYAFAPDGLGDFEASVVLASNDPDGDVIFDLAGVGEAPAIAVPAFNLNGLVLLMIGVAATAAVHIRRR